MEVFAHGFIVVNVVRKINSLSPEVTGSHTLSLPGVWGLYSPGPALPLHPV